MLIKQGKTNIKYLLIVITIAIIVGGVMLFATEITKCPCWWSSPQQATTTEDETADWKTYRNAEYGFEIKYPSNWSSLEDADYISITEKEKFKNDYENCLIEKDEGTCQRMFGGGYDDLLKRIELVKDVQDENLTHDKASHCFEGSGPCEPIRGFDFDCDAIGGYVTLRTIYNENLNMNLVRTIGYCGFDVDLGNYYYWSPVVINDNLIEIGFKLFPFNEVSPLYRDLGYTKTEDGVWFCDAECYQKEIEYLEGLDLDSDLIKGVVEKYDYIIKSIKTF